MYTYAKREDTKNNFGNAKKEPARKRNQTGIPDALKSSMELFSGFSLDDVRVHYSSDKPERLQALAYTQGNQIYLGTGHENSLPHEMGHVIQQKQGRVRVTPNPAGLPVNLERELEEEADWIGSMAMRGWNHPQSAGIQQGSGSVLAAPVIQMDYEKKFAGTKANILRLLRDKAIIGLSNWEADNFTWHHIYPKRYLLEDQSLKSLAEHADFISLGPAPAFRMDDPGSAGLDYDYLPYGEREQPVLTPVSELLRQNGTTNLENMKDFLKEQRFGGDVQDKHLDINLKWAQWFIPSEKLGSVFGDDLISAFTPYLRNYKVYQSRFIDGKEQEIQDISGLPLLSLDEKTLGKPLYAEIERRYQQNGDAMFVKAMRRGSQGAALNPEQREIERKRQLISSGFIQRIIGELDPSQKSALRQHGYAFPKALQDIERYLIQYGIDIRPKTVGLTLETIETLDISDQFKSFQRKVQSLQQSKSETDKMQLWRWFCGEGRNVVIGSDPLSQNLRSFFQLLQEMMKQSAGSSQKEQAKPKTQSGRKKGKKGGKQVNISNMSITELLGAKRKDWEKVINLDWLIYLLRPEEPIDERNRAMSQLLLGNEITPIYELPAEMVEEEVEKEEGLSMTARRLKEEYQDIAYEGGDDQTEVIFERLGELKVSDLNSPSIRNLLLYRAGIMDHYERLLRVSSDQDWIEPYFARIQKVVAGKIDKVTKLDQPVPKDKELYTASWNIANQVEIIIGEPDDQYLARVQEAILQVVAPIVEEPQVEEDMVEIPEADDLTGTP